jgi:hypothetical protein
VDLEVELSRRIDAEEFYRMLEGVVIDDTDLFDDRLQEWIQAARRTPFE